MTRAALLPLLLLAGCDLSMKQQAKQNPQASAAFWPGGPPRADAPEGTIAAGQPGYQAAVGNPPPLTPALLDRGEERYGIYCVECHGARGEGDGLVVQRGFPRPPSFHEARLVAAPPTYIVEVITNGHGIMYSYADRVVPRDRWAIAAYVKALQQARPK